MLALTRRRSDDDHRESWSVYYGDVIELINGPMLFEHKATPAQYKAGLNLAVERGWLVLHESGTFVRFSQTGKDLFA